MKCMKSKEIADHSSSICFVFLFAYFKTNVVLSFLSVAHLDVPRSMAEDSSAMRSTGV